MASLLSGITFLENFGFYSVLFPLILIMAITYGLLSKIKPFGDDTTINIIVALIVGFMVVSVTPAIIFIRLLVPYITAFFIVILFIVMMFQFLGVKSDALQEAYTSPLVYGAIFIVILIGVFLFISESFPELKIGQQTTDSTSTSSIIGSTGAEEVQQVTEIREADGTTTVILDPEQETSTRRDLLRNTVFHPTMLALLILVMVFGAAVYMIAIIEKS